MKHYRKPSTAPADEVAQLVGYMPIIVCAPDIPDKDRVFCASIIKQSRRPAFAASDGQVYVMRQIVGKFKDANMRGDGGEVTE